MTLISVLMVVVSIGVISMQGFGQTIIPSGTTAPQQVQAVDVHNETATYSSTSPLNWVRTYTPQAPIADATQVTIHSGYPEVGLTTQYIDGLGRPIQTVSRGATPLGKDIVAPIAYDEFGRESFQYLPYASSTATNGSFKTVPFSEQQSFMQTMYPGEQVYYGKTDFEASPLNRITKVMAPGNSWAGYVNGEIKGRGVTTTYDVNGSSEVRIWTISVGANAMPVVGGFYTGGENASTSVGGQLYRTVTVDEDGSRVVEYRDKGGQMVLKRVQISTNALYSDESKWNSTYYVYDDLSNLRMVIPPKAMEQVIKANWIISPEIVSELCFYYEYDQRKRMTLKKIPGAGEVYMVYDSKDRLVMSQDANMRQRSDKQWMYTQYDELNRPTSTGLLTRKTSGLITQTDYDSPVYHRDNANASASYPDLSLFNATEYSNIYYDNYTWMSNGQQGGGLNTVFNPGQVTQAEFLPSSFSTFPYAQPVSGTTGSVNGLVTGTRTKVVTAVGQTSSVGYLYSVSFYDDLRRPVQVQASNIMQGMDIVTTQYSFDGKVLVVKVVQNMNTTTSITIVTRNEYDLAGRLVKVYKNINGKGEKLLVKNNYDQMGKLSTKDLGGKVVNGTVAPLESLAYDYNIRGWLTGINKGYANGQSSGNWFGMQLSYDYGFAVAKGGEKNNGGVDPSTGSTVQSNVSIQPADDASEYLATTGIDFSGEYDSQDKPPYDAHIVTAQVTVDDVGLYNGNIAGTIWRSKGDGERRAYGFTYDISNRLLSADFTQSTANIWNRYAGLNFSMALGDGKKVDDAFKSAYDANGNIKKMLQWGFVATGSAQIDNLKYEYYPLNGVEGNKLMRVSETPGGTAGGPVLGDFQDKHPLTSTDSPNDYGYDGNGNMVTDLNKMIGVAGGALETVTSGGGIEYNYLNLPASIIIKAADGSIKGTISYLYDAGGNKLQKLVVENGNSNNNNITTSTITTYMGASVFESKSYSLNDAQHQNYADQLQFIGHEEGRARPLRDANNQIVDFAYDYFIKDHLGDVRIVLTEETKTVIYPAATLEGDLNNINDAAYIEKQYYNIDPGAVVLKTDATNISAYANNNTIANNNPNSNSTANSQKLYKLDGNTHKIGLGITMKVMAGDQVSILGKSYYFNSGSTIPNGLIPVAAVLSMFIGGSPVSGKGLTSSQLSSDVPGLASGVGEFLTNGRSGQNGPQAYINWVFFDEQMRYVSGSYDPIASMGQVKSHVINGITVPKSGYIFIYCSNESPIDVFFDNLQVIHTKGPLQEETHYYPFGLTMSGISSKSAGGLENKTKFNGIEHNNDFDLSMYDAFYRNLDPQVGRFWQIDPSPNLSESLYSAMNDNPILKADFLGDTAIVFGSNGNFLRFQDDGKKRFTGRRITSETTTTNADGTTTTVTKYNKFKLNDGKLVAQAVKNGVINKVEMVSGAKMDRLMDRSGVTSAAARNSPLSYAKAQGVSAGAMDYAVAGAKAGDLNKNTLYVTDGVGYDIADFGNFLFGRGIGELGIPSGFGETGGQYNHILNSRRGNDVTPLFDLGPGTYGAPGWFDAASDQQAIGNGYSSSPAVIKAHQEIQQRIHNYMQNWRPYQN